MRLFFFLSILLTILNGNCQNSTNTFFWDNVQFGGGLNLSFSNNNTVIGISPSAIYNFSDQFASGISISYLYVKNKNITNPINIYGASVLARYKPIEEIQLITEFEQNFLKQGNTKTTIPALYLGAGYNFNRNIAFGLRYDILYDKNNNIYPSAITPFIKVYF
jgi:predicted porin